METFQEDSGYMELLRNLLKPKFRMKFLDESQTNVRGLVTPDIDQRRDLLEISDDRYQQLLLANYLLRIGRLFK